MRTAPSVASPLALAAVAAALAGSPEGSGDQMLEMEVAGVVPLEDGQSSLLLLAQKGQGALLSLVIGRAEGNAIDLSLRKAVPPRPMTHDLLDKAIGELGGKVIRVEIDGLKDSTFLATVRLTQGRRTLALDARPSDSVALALRVKAPIFAARKVMQAAGVTRQDLDRLRREPWRRPPGRDAPAFEGAQKI